MDFFRVKERSRQKVGRPKRDSGGELDDGVEIYPDFIVCPSKDLMVRGGKFYAIWNEKTAMWSTKEYDVTQLVDEELYARQTTLSDMGITGNVRSMASFSSKSWLEFRNYLGHIFDHFTQLDEKLTFSNTKVSKQDYVSKRLSYPLEAGSFEAYDQLISTLYDPEEREKLEWAIGAIVAGEAKNIQKFLVLYGEAGAGKSTILNIIQKLFDGYYSTFEAKALVGSNNTFALEMFRLNPLVAIQHDGDLSKIEDNSKLNSIISHEEMTINEKFKSGYTSKINTFLFMATNKPVKITDAKSGIIRRLIDVTPSGRRLPSSVYFDLMAKINFELGAIAHHCLDVYKSLGKEYYSSYRPLSMMFQTDPFFNFVESNYDAFSTEDGITLNRAYEVYKQYCEEASVDFKLPRHKFREELKNYFREFCDVTRVDNKQVRSYYRGFKRETFFVEAKPTKQKQESWLVLDKGVSIFDQTHGSFLAQYASEKDIPMFKWNNVTTILSEIDTSKTHYVMTPDNEIIIDFDLTDASGQKSAELNLEAAGKWPPTYAEYSKGGSGIHLHYYYDGDVNRLARLFSPGIEVKTFNVGNSSLRRRLSKCNDLSIATINSGLPLKEEKMIDFDAVKSERALRDLIKRNLAKDIHPGTKPSVDFIHKILEDAYSSGLKYDVSDMRQKILIFASKSTHQADYCVKLVGKMKFKSEEPSPSKDEYKDDVLVFFDVEVFPNLFLVNWKMAGEDKTCVRMVNPAPGDIEDLFKFKLVGFNCRRYDNHMLYARYIGYDNMQLYKLSQKIVSGEGNPLFSEAYSISYTDVYDFASAANKKSLKKFEIELGIHHQELGLPWDQPVPEEKWIEVAEYCDNDVIATEAVFNALKGDWTARQILAEISGLSVNDTTNQHSTRIIFGDNKKPQSQLVYTDLSEMFPGYKFESGKSSYRDEDPGEGGYVYAEPGIHRNVALLDVASMHPTSIEQLNLFGPYTKTYSDLKSARLAIKHKDRESLGLLLGGKLLPFFDRAEAGEFKLKDLSTALKTALNSAYGLTSAKFDNPFRDPRNVDNIVAKRGALFMIDLKYAVQERGFTVAHIKTDSIKIPDATPEIINFVFEFGKKYGYEFEHEASYDRMCLVNDAVYIAKYKDPDLCQRDYGYIPDECQKHPNAWTATGAQFAHPFVFKTLFSHEEIEFKDLCETKSVTTAMYLDMNEGLGDVEEKERELKKVKDRFEVSRLTEAESNYLQDNIDELEREIASNHDYRFIGRAGSFCPIMPGFGGGLLVREKDGKYYAVTGTKGYRWLESEAVQLLEKENDIDMTYFTSLTDTAAQTIYQHGDFESFVSSDIPPWKMPCGKECYDNSCISCTKYLREDCGFNKIPF